MSPSATDNRLVIRRRLPVSRDRVFRAWTEPASLQHWFFQFQPDTCVEADIDLRVGGTYFLCLRSCAGEVIYAVRGHYHEVIPPAKLVFSWRWEVPALDATDTIVTLVLHDLGDATELVMTHDRLPDQEGCWDNRLDRLMQYLV